MTTNRRSAHSERSLAQRVAVLLAVVLQIAPSFLPSLGIGEPVGTRSDAVRTLVTPAGWAFAIWGPIFAGSVLFAIYQALPGQRHNDLLRRIAWPAAGTFAANGIWSIYTQLNALTAISAIIIVVSLACALAVYRAFIALGRPFTAGERWLAMLPLTALASWLTAATIVNITATLTYYEVGGGGPHPLLAAGIVVVGGTMPALAVWQGRGNPVYAAVFLWALAAITAAGGRRAQEVAIAAAISAVLVIIAAVAGLRDPANRRHWLG